MESIWNLFRHLRGISERRERERRDAYLAESTDLYDLEYRMRELDRNTQPVPAWMRTTAPW